MSSFLLPFCSRTLRPRASPFAKTSLVLKAIRQQRVTPNCFTKSPRRGFASMSDLSVELTAPNGKKYTQPIGLFINNEWVKSSDGEKITSINPR